MATISFCHLWIHLDLDLYYSCGFEIRHQPLRGKIARLLSGGPTARNKAQRIPTQVCGGA